MSSIFPLGGAFGRGTPPRSALRHAGPPERRVRNGAASGAERDVRDLDAVGRPHTVKTTGGDKSFPIVTEAADLRKAHSGR